MSDLYNIDDIPACCLSCKNKNCFPGQNISKRKYAYAIEEDEETGEETCPYYLGSEHFHEYD